MDKNAAMPVCGDSTPDSCPGSTMTAPGDSAFAECLRQHEGADLGQNRTGDSDASGVRSLAEFRSRVVAAFYGAAFGPVRHVRQTRMEGNFKGPRVHPLYWAAFFGIWCSFLITRSPTTLSGTPVFLPQRSDTDTYS